MGFPKFETPPSVPSATSDHWFLTTMGMRMNSKWGYDPSSSPWFLIAHRCEFPDPSMRYCTTVPRFPWSEIAMSWIERRRMMSLPKCKNYPMPRNGRNPEPLAPELPEPRSRALWAVRQQLAQIFNGDDSKKNLEPSKKHVISDVSKPHRPFSRYRVLAWM